MMGSLSQLPLDFSQVSLQIPPHCLYLLFYSSCCYTANPLSNPISTPPQSQSFLTRLYSYSSPLPSSRETFQCLSTFPQILGVSFQ